MTRPEPLSLLRVHEDPDRFREAVRFYGGGKPGFSPPDRKEYFCTLLLDYLSAADGSLVFKGGTCLAKVHAGFYRLSEDLDFVIPTPHSASRSGRRAVWREDSSGRLRLSGSIECLFGWSSRLRVQNNSTQYIAVGLYIADQREEETVKVEAGLREPLLTPAVIGQVPDAPLQSHIGQTAGAGNPGTMPFPGVRRWPRNCGRPCHDARRQSGISTISIIMITDINSEDRLVQQTFADHLREGARLGERLRLQRGDLRAQGHAGPRVRARGGAGARPAGGAGAAQPGPARNRRASRRSRSSRASTSPARWCSTTGSSTASSATACRSSGAMPQARRGTPTPG